MIDQLNIFQIIKELHKKKLKLRIFKMVVMTNKIVKKKFNKPKSLRLILTEK